MKGLISDVRLRDDFALVDFRERSKRQSYACEVTTLRAVHKARELIRGYSCFH